MADNFVDPFDNDVTEAVLSQGQFVDPFDAPQFEPESNSGALHGTITGRPRGDAGKPTGDDGAGFVANFKANLVDDPDLKARLVADKLFPNDPNRYERVGYRGNELVYRDDRGGFQEVDAGFVSGLGEFAADAPEMVGAGVGAALGSIAGGAGAVPGAVLGASAGDAYKRLFANLVLGEEQTAAGNAIGIATEAAFTAAGEGIGRFGLSQLNRRSVTNADKFSPDSADALRARIKQETGIDLDYAQAGNVRQLRDLKKWASKYPSDAAEIIEAQKEVQQGQVSEGIQRMLDAISPGNDPERLASSGINAAKGIIAAAEETARAAARPFYQKADEAFLDDAVVEGLFQDPVIRQAANRVRGNAAYQREIGEIQPYRTDAPIPTGMTQIKFLDLVKRNIDDQIESARQSNAKNRVRLLTGAKEILESTLKKNNADYAKALETFAKISQETVNPLRDGIIGVIAKIDNPRMANTVAALANDILANPQLTKSTKTIFLNQGKRGEWDNIVKLSLANKFDKAAKELAGGEPGNIAGKFRSAVIGTPRQKAALAGALDGRALNAFETTMEALEMIGKDPPQWAGSDTAFNQAISQQQMDAARPALEIAATGIVTLLNPLEWRTALRERGQQDFLERNSVVLAEALTDPAKVRKLAELKSLPPGLEKSALVLSAVFGASMGEMAQESVTPSGEPVPE